MCNIIEYLVPVHPDEGLGPACLGGEIHGVSSGCLGSVNVK